MRFRISEISSLNYQMALKIDKHLGNNNVDHSDPINLNTNIKDFVIF